jgi:hypothetical protein
MKIHIETVPHEKQRYPTCGDWQFINPEYLKVSVSAMHNPDYEFLVGIHETIEAWLAVKRAGPGVEKVLDAFDIEYENNRQEGDTSEPGDDPRCPVYLEHQIATGIERILAGMIGVEWQKYDQGVNDL